MKNYLRLLMLACAVLLATGCHRNTLENAVKAFDAKCPVEYGAGGTLQHITLDENSTVTYHITVGEMVDVEALNASPRLLKESIDQQYASPTPELRALFAEIARRDGRLRVVFTGQKGARAEYELSTAEIRDILEGRVRQSSPYELLQTQIEITNRQMPIQATGMVVQRVVEERDLVIYESEVDNTVIQLENLRSQQAELHDFLLENVLEDPAAADFAALVARAGRSLAYRYTQATPPDTVLIVLTNGDLQAALK